MAELASALARQKELQPVRELQGAQVRRRHLSWPAWAEQPQQPTARPQDSHSHRCPARPPQRWRNPQTSNLESPES